MVTLVPFILYNFSLLKIGALIKLAISFVWVRKSIELLIAVTHQNPTLKINLHQKFVKGKKKKSISLNAILHRCNLKQDFFLHFRLFPKAFKDYSTVCLHDRN